MHSFYRQEMQEKIFKLNQPTKRHNRTFLLKIWWSYQDFCHIKMILVWLFISYFEAKFLPLQFKQFLSCFILSRIWEKQFPIANKILYSFKSFKTLALSYPKDFSLSSFTNSTLAAFQIGPIFKIFYCICCSL